MSTWWNFPLVFAPSVCADCVKARLGPWQCFTAGCSECNARALESVGRQPVEAARVETEGAT